VRSLKSSNLKIELLRYSEEDHAQTENVALRRIGLQLENLRRNEPWRTSFAHQLLLINPLRKPEILNRSYYTPSKLPLASSASYRAIPASRSPTSNPGARSSHWNRVYVFYTTYAIS
jgi:hypothetical protein